MCGSMADLGALKALADTHGLLLIEDACQAIGGSYRGRPLGSIGHIGCFSFDFVKTVTCGEGGALITDDPLIYERAQAYSDHGHDHVGSDRGAEGHPFLGYNFRISELHAAVGLAQLARLDEFLAVQKHHYTALRRVLEGIPGIRFRRVPEGGEENYSFLNFFMDTPEEARLAQRALAEAGVDGTFYWYDNNWHYHRRWEHLKSLKSLGSLPGEVREGFSRLNDRDFPASDQWMGRALSILIKLSWSPQELERRCEALRKALGRL
jgi:8-amino-3,8-dideoxy-alpha-D-manno-octulosonate transaminase